MSGFVVGGYCVPTLQQVSDVLNSGYIAHNIPTLSNAIIDGSLIKISSRDYVAGLGYSIPHDLLSYSPTICDEIGPYPFNQFDFASIDPQLLMSAFGSGFIITSILFGTVFGVRACLALLKG